MKISLLALIILTISILVSCDTSKYEVKEYPSTINQFILYNFSSEDTLHIEWKIRDTKSPVEYSKSLTFDEESIAAETRHLVTWSYDSLDGLGNYEKLTLGGFSSNEFHQPIITEEQIASFLPDIKVFKVINNEKILVLDKEFFHQKENWNIRQGEHQPDTWDHFSYNIYKLKITDEMIKP